MSKVYILVHDHLLKKDLSETPYEFVDTKLIGIFFSEQEKQHVLDLYKKLPGFRNHSEQFRTEEFKLDILRISGDSNLEKDNADKGPCLEKLYLLYNEKEHGNGDLFWSIQGVFSSRNNAEDAKRQLDSLPEPNNGPGQLEIYENTIGVLGWKEGFICDDI